MPRKIISLPETFHFSSEYQVLNADVNQAGHLAADRIPAIATEIQLRYLQFLGYSLAELFEDVGLIMAHSEIAYLSESAYEDVLKVDVTVDNIAGKSFDIVYRLFNLTQSIETARIRNTMLFFDYEKKCVKEIPQHFITSTKK